MSTVPPQHKLLARQLRKASEGESLNLDSLLNLIDQTYCEHDRIRKVERRSMQSMSEELMALNAAVRNERDAAVAQSEQRFEMVAEGTNDGIWDWDVQNDVLWFSKRFKAMLGYGGDELTQCAITDWRRLVHGDDIAKADDFIRACQEGGLSPVTLRFRHKSGALFHFLCHASTLKDFLGKVRRVVGVHTDVSALMSMQEALKAAHDEAVAGSRAKSDFLANMSHEIRTPMNSIMGMLSLLLETPLDPQQRLWAEVARQSSDSLLDIINDILDLSKIESGRFELEEISFDLCDTIERVTDTLVFKAQEKNIELLTRYDQQVPIRLKGDPMRLRQILLNLLGNALKFTHNGFIAISVDSAPAAGGKAHLLFEVEDTGIGIPPDKLEYIFEKFSQAEESTTRKFGGTGLGLAICRRLVGMMGGRASVTSTLGKGSTFKFDVYLPVDRTAPPSLVEDYPDLSQMRVMVVDDNPKSLAIFREYFSAWRMEASFHTEPMGALEALRQAAASQRPFHILLVDYYLQGMNGSAFAFAVRREGFPPLQLAAIRHGDPGNIQKMEEEGFEAVILKPFTPSRLMNKLSLLWSQHNSGEKHPFLVSFKDRNNESGALSHKDFSGVRLLVVEDLKANRLYMQSLLKRHGAIPDMATNGREALEKVGQTSYDIIFMDCQMPEMDGFEATRAIRTMPLAHQPRIIALTADAMQGDRERCLDAGMDDYLNKPVRTETVAEILERYAATKKAA